VVNVSPCPVVRGQALARRLQDVTVRRRPWRLRPEVASLSMFTHVVQLGRSPSRSTD
jgi:hypothetical protein